MKVAFLTREYPPDTAWGGVASVYYTLATALAKRGYEVHVICQAVAELGDFTQTGVFVHRVGTNPKRYSAIARINYNFHAWLKLRKIIKERNIEIVDTVCWGVEGFLYSLFKSIPVIIRAQTSANDVLQSKTYSGLSELMSLKFLSYLEDFSLRRASKVVANSKVTHNRLVEDLHIAPEKVAIVHDTIDTDRYRFTKSNIRYKLGIPDNERVVLAVGRLEPRKGTYILCQAIPEIVKNVPDIRFVLVGRDTAKAPNGGSFKEYIIKLAQTYNSSDRIMFVDFLPEDELVQLYSACDVFVLPSLHESFGLVIVEAMACGKLVVATPVGIVPELTASGLKGLSVVPVGDSQKLAEAVVDFLMLPGETARQLGNENRKLVEARFSVPAWIDLTIKVYKSLAKQKVL